MIGKLFDSLSHRIEKNLAESTYINETYIENKWNRIEELVIRWTKRPILTVFLLIVFFLFSSLFLFLLRIMLKKEFFFWNQSWENLLNWQNTFLSTQITIIALIFPLVIGFVGFLIQNKSSQRALWKIYMYYSGVKLLGFSSITLSAVILLVQFIKPWMNYQLEVAITINTLCWLLFNISLLAWFLYATFDFISTEKRSKIILRYCINEMIINEIKYRLANLLPQTIFGNREDTNDKPKVYPFHLFSEKYQDYCRIEFSNYKYVYDIDFNFLKVAGFIWKFRNKNFKGEAPTLYFPVSGISKAKIYNLAYSENTNINLLEKFLIKTAYSFRRTSRLEESNFDSIIHALISNVEDSLKEKDERLFEIALDELAYWIIQIFKTASFKNDNKELDNWILLPDGNFFGRSIIQNLSREFYKINKKSIDLLSYSDIYFRKMCYFNLKVFGYKNDVLPSKVIEELLQNHYYSWSLLMKKINNLENNEEYLKAYIGSWESWISSSKINFKDEKSIDYLIDIYLKHLQTSSKHIISALNVNNEKSILLSVDMLIYWNYQSFHMFNKSNNYYGWKSKLLNPFIIKSNFNSEYIDKEKLNDYLFPTDSKDEKTALVLSMENFWKEVCIITGIYIFYRYKDIFSDNIKKVVLSLLRQERIYSNNMDLISTKNSQIDTNNIFESYLFNTYPMTSILKNGHSAYLIELFERMNQESFISGRVHTCRSIGLSNLSQTFKFIMIANSIKVWKFSNEFNDFVKSPLFEYELRESLIREINNFRCSKDIDDKLLDDVILLFGDDNIEKKIDNYKKSIDNILEDLKNYQDKILIDAPVDYKSIDNLNILYSNELFTKLNFMPYILFKNIKFDSLEQKFEKIININIYKKYLAKDINFIDINNYWEHLNRDIILDLREKISNEIFDKFLIKLKIKKELSFGNIEKLLINVVDDAQKLIKKDSIPILFVCSNEIKWMLENETYDKQFKNILIEKFDNKEENYICHIDNIEVYELSVHDGDYAILTSLEMFDEVIFNEYEKDIYSKIEIQNSEREIEKIVSFNYRMKINFKKVNSYKYNFKDKTNAQLL